MTPPWHKIRQAFQGIFHRKYYTNHFCVVPELEKRLQRYYKVKHIICITNSHIASLMRAKLPAEKINTISVSSCFPFAGCAYYGTDDDITAAKLRNMRSSYGAGEKIDVPITANGRVSDAQAALALLEMEDWRF